MSDLDEDLLALAGAGSGEETDEESNIPLKRAKSTKGVARKRSKQADYSDDDDQGEDDESDGYEPEDPYSKNNENDDDDDDETEEEKIIRNPYPLDGIYIDEADRARLEAMDQLAREAVLTERADERDRFQRDEILNQRIRERKRQAKQASKTKPEPKDSKLKELGKRRQEKETRNKLREEGVDFRQAASDSSDDDEIEDYDEEEEYDEDEDRVEWAEPEKQAAVDEKAVNNIRWTRHYLAKYFHYPGFEEAVQGCFVRVNQVNKYMVGVVKELVPCKPYQVEDTRVDRQLRLAIGSSVKTMGMNFCSDGSIGREEFEEWKAQMDQDNMSLPSMKKIERKLKELTEFRNHTLTNQEIEDMVERKRQINGTFGASAVVEKSSLMEARVIALEKGDYTKLEEIDQRLAEIDSQLTRTRRQQEKDKLAKVNERNRKSNLADIRRAEILANEQRRKAELTGRNADPFSRLKTSARIFYNSNTDATVSKSQTEEEEPEAKEKAAPVKQRSNKVLRVDDVIGALNIELEFKI